MKAIFGIVIFFSATTTLAQIDSTNARPNQLMTPTPASTPSDYRWTIYASGNYHNNSNAVTNHFFKIFEYQRGFIDSETKDETSKRLRNVNRFGADVRTEAYAARKLNNEFTFALGATYRNFTAVRFPADVYELMFRGNKTYAGKTAQLSKLSFTRFHYASFDSYVFKNVKSHLTLGAGLSLIRGGKVRLAKIRSGELFTEETGQYIDLDSDISYSFSPKDTARKNKSNGIGAAIHVFARLNQNNTQINFELRDVGLIRWEKLIQYSGDSAYRYSGLIVNDLFSTTDASLVSDLNVDSIARQLNIHKKETNKLMVIPFSIRLNMIRQLSNKKWMAGIDYLYTAGYLPRVYAGIEYGKSVFFSGKVAYGGFGRIDYELGAGYQKANTFRVSANFIIIEYLLLPKSTSGHGFTLTIEKKI